MILVARSSHETWCGFIQLSRSLSSKRTVVTPFLYYSPLCLRSVPRHREGRPLWVEKARVFLGVIQEELRQLGVVSTPGIHEEGAVVTTKAILLP